MLKEWTEPPPMSAAAPAPAILSSDGTLWLAYRIARDPHHCAVLRFHRGTVRVGCAACARPGEAWAKLGSFGEVPAGNGAHPGNRGVGG
jgi:hypothetical protein